MAKVEILLRLSGNELLESLGRERSSAPAVGLTPSGVWMRGAF